MSRAVWLIKMTSAYSVAISEAKMKKRQVPDSSQGVIESAKKLSANEFSCKKHIYIYSLQNGLVP